MLQAELENGILCPTISCLRRFHLSLDDGVTEKWISDLKASNKRRNFERRDFEAVSVQPAALKVDYAFSSSLPST